MKRFDVGARVVEPTYGLGSVIAVEDGTRLSGLQRILESDVEEEADGAEEE